MPQKETLDKAAYTCLLVFYRRLSPLFQFSLSAVTLVYLSQWFHQSAYVLLNRVSDIWWLSVFFEHGPIDPTWSQCTLFVLWFYGIQMTQWTQKEGRGTLSFCPCISFIFEWWSCEEGASSKLPVALISSVLPLSDLCPGSLLFDASITKKSGSTL